MNLQKKTLRTGDLLFGIVTAVLLIIKCFSFYSQLNLESYVLPLTLATAAIHFLVYTLLLDLHPRLARIVTTTFYTIGSLFIAIDLVYFAYVSKLPSAALLGLLWQAQGISDMLESLITPSAMLMLADLPLLVLCAVNRDLLYRRFPKPSLWLHRPLRQAHAVFCGAGTAVLVALLLCVYPGFRMRYMANELISYHMSDFAKTLFAMGNERQVDKSLYTEPDWSDKDYYGIAENRNLIVIQVEALQNFVIGQSYEGQELTPVLNSLIQNDTYYAPNYYYQIGGGNTSDAEFHVNNSLFAPEDAAAYIRYTDKQSYGLPRLLKDNGYSGAHAFHNYIASFWNREGAYPSQGFDSFTSLEDLEMIDPYPMGISDLELFRQSMEQLKTYEEPFYAFYVTVSSHHPYSIPEKDRAVTLRAEDDGTLFGSYLQAVNYADDAIGAFLAMLKEAGLYENSVIVIYGDHYALTNTDFGINEQVQALTGENYTIFDVFNVPLLIHIPGMGYSETLSAAGGHMDVMPTLLPLLGIRNTQTVMFGQNLLETEEGFVCEQTHVSRGSFISNDIFFSKPHNNILENYDAYRKDTMTREDPLLFESLSEQAEQRILDCEALIKQNDIFLN